MPPAVDELEISLFGPGYGESVLLHIGEGQWVIIDSCIDNTTKQPAALQYLKDMGFDPSEDVKLVVATHWHDDHVRGLGQIIQECRQAAFVCPTAIKNKEFLKLVELNRNIKSLSADSGVCEFLSIINTLRKRQTPPIYAIADRRVWHQPPPKGSQLVGCTIHSLSPSDAEVEKALNSLSRLFPEAGTEPRRVPPPTQNDTAVALWVNMGGENKILLGSDLEEDDDIQTGWSAVLKLQMEADGRASIFKVAHHGSDNGHHQDVWDKMLCQNACALLTPFTRGRKPLPSTADASRISSQTEHAYITALSSSNKKVKQRDPFVKKMIKRSTLFIKNAEPACGQIKMRKKIQDSNKNWKIELIGGASKLMDVVC